MTTQEAIERIKYRIYTATTIVGKGEDGKAFEDLEMAIKALEEIDSKAEITLLNASKCPTCGSVLSKISTLKNLTLKV